MCFNSIFFAISFMGRLSGSQSVSKVPDFEIHRPTLIAFFAPVTKTELNDDEAYEALADFQFSASTVRPQLEKSGIDFYETYSRTFRIVSSNNAVTFRAKEGVGYYFVAPGKEPHISYGVMTDSDIERVAGEYFGAPARR
jgi:hypothetical protein